MSVPIDKLHEKRMENAKYRAAYEALEPEFALAKEDKGVRIFVDPTAIMFLLGSEMDYTEDKLQSGFVFRNPNEKGRCGCGESFHV
jgi:iron-sulfur cluster assembly accessory protein